MSQSSRRLALVGAGVGVATAGVITFLVVKGEPKEEERSLSRVAEAVERAPSQAAGGPVTAAPPIAKVEASTTPSVKDAAKAADEAKKAEDDAKAAAKKKADDDAKLARKQAIDQARKNGIIGSTALKQGGAFASLTGTGNISSGFDDDNIYGGLLGNEAGEMNGGYGFGRSGFGPGGGGTGWGTIGTGRYGVIGQGSGTGSGYGVGAGRGGMRGRSAAVPTISIGQPNVIATAGDGELDKAIIRRYVKRNIQKLQYCYEKELLAKPALGGGVVKTQFTITESGLVGTASASGVDPTVANCMALVIKGIEFPKPKGTGGVTVTYPFTVRPAGQ
jgi:hypothetical protein